MRALVTGCAGFIGSHLTEALLERGDAVVGIDCFNDNYGRAQKLANLRRVLERERFQFLPVDLACGDLDELTADTDVIFHLAAEPGARAGWGARYGRYVRNNILATQQLLETVRHRPSVRLVMASSSSVYGNADRIPTPEDAPLQPVSPYAQTKVSAEQLCSLYRATYASDTVCLRLFTVYGPRQRPDMAFHSFLTAALEGRRISVFGDGLQTRDFTYVDDAVAATLAAAAAPLGAERVLNVGGGSPASIRSVLDTVRRLAGTDLEAAYLPAGRSEVRHTRADTSRARRVLGWEPRTPLDEGLAHQFEWLVGALEPAPAEPR